MTVTVERVDRLEDRVNREAEKTNDLQSGFSSMKTDLRWIKILLIGVLVEGGVLIFQLLIGK